ncbi:hypothetical protein ACFWIA_09820 [Streptomyces sp. NPDC127068]|uniref:hypothetical protein n=1 Tax=Streptomyces sp. NPDC127068 TaxID=3347127 RepID=UPI003660BB7A
MRTMKIPIAVALLGLLVAGCSDGDGDPDRSDSRSKALALLPQQVPEPAALPDAALQPSPAAGAPFGEQLAYELRTRTLNMAKAGGDVSAECPDSAASKAGTELTCTSTYEGLKLTWDVKIGETSDFSSSHVEYQATPRKAVLTRDGAARLLYGNYTPDAVRCSGIPRAVLVPLDSPTSYRCQTVKDGKPGLAQNVRVTDAGPRFY